jgi:signal transduction histidine kinase
MVGKNLIDLKDQDGKFLIRELSDVAKKGNGWVDYKWPNPLTKLIEAKSSYVERMGDYFVGVGVYR